MLERKGISKELFTSRKTPSEKYFLQNFVSKQLQSQYFIFSTVWCKSVRQCSLVLMRTSQILSGLHYFILFCIHIRKNGKLKSTAKQNKVATRCCFIMPRERKTSCTYTPDTQPSKQVFSFFNSVYLNKLGKLSFHKIERITGNQSRLQSTYP